MMYLMKHVIYTICSSHRNDHRTLSIDCDLHKLMNIILCQLKNLEDLLSLSPLIIINSILSGVLAIIAFYLTSTTTTTTTTTSTDADLDRDNSPSECRGVCYGRCCH